MIPGESNGSLDALAAQLAELDAHPTVARYQALSRELGALSAQLRPLKVAMLASFTIDPLVPFLRVEAARHGFAAAVYVAPFNSVRRELLDPDSGCARHQPDIVFIDEQLGDVCAPIVEDYLGLAADDVTPMIEQAAAELVAACIAFRARARAPIVVGNFVLPPAALLGIGEPTAEPSQTTAIRRLNVLLAEAARGVPDLYVNDVDHLASNVGSSRWFDPRMWATAGAPMSMHALPVLASSHGAFIRALFAPPRKCLVVDLDNTIWGGVLGEDGLAGIQVGHTYPGNTFRRFQQELLSLYRRGVLLAINSKNNPAEVAEVFQSHPDMVLRAEHFSAMRINWCDKVGNMLEIAADLNLGLDSLVFLDDSPAECELMRRGLPEVMTIQAPADALESPSVLRRSRAFERLRLSSEDLQRGRLYQRRIESEQYRRASDNLDQYLAGLEMTAEIRPVDRLSLARAVELTQKTNQFNLTTRRYSAADMVEVIDSPRCGAFSLRLRDRFGDNGIVGLAIARVEGDAASIDTFLLSCRVIGRSAETALLAFLVEWTRARGLRFIDGEFSPTPKNAPAADFYRRHGFFDIGQNGPGNRWRLDVLHSSVERPSCVRLVDAEPSVT